MVQSEYTEETNNTEDDGKGELVLPKRSFSTEFFVGLFALLGVAAGAYQAIGLGGLRLFESNRYKIYAEFDNVSGLKSGAPVEVAGVPVGNVTNIVFKEPVAIVTLAVDRSIKLHDDDVIAVHTKGIIGDKYLKISQGSSDILVNEGDTVVETESVVDFEDILGKVINNMGSDDE